MHTELLSPAELGPAEIAAWRRLAAEALEPNPYFEPEFVLPAARLLGDNPSLLVVREDDGDSWLFCLPVQRRRRWRRVASGPCLVSWRHLYCFLGTPLVSARDPQGALGSVLAWTTTGVAGGFIGLDLLAGDGPVTNVLRVALADHGGRSVVYERRQRAAVRGGDGNVHLAMNRKHQREVSRQRRRLGEYLGATLELRDRGAESDAAERFLTLEASGWKGTAGTALASKSRHRDFFLELCAGFAAEGRLQLLSYETPSRGVAALCSLKSGDAVFLFKIAYDEELARFSPGIQLLVAAVEDFRENPLLKLMDSCAEPDNEMINRLWADRRTMDAIAIPAPGPRGRAAGLMVSAASRLTRRQR